MAGSNPTQMYLLLCCFFLLLLAWPTSAGIFGWVETIACYFKKCCDDKWIIKDFKGLEEALNSKLHGQHLVKKTVLGHIKAHFKTSNPSKALVLSFHGPTGVGKNHVARIIAQNIYKDGMHSKFVHLISATKEFQHDDHLHFYKDKLKNMIEKNAKICERSMFIFDEVDKLPSQLLDVIKPYLDHYDHIDGVDYRKNVYIFLSNSGSSRISRTLMENWKEGKKREDLKLRDVEHDVMLSAINDERNAGLWHSHLISNSLITAFIPFLPLEKQHVRLCIQEDMLAKRYFNLWRDIPAKVVDEVIQELKFMPEVEQIFSATGCKRISEKVDYVMVEREPGLFEDLHIPKRQKDEI